MSTIDRTPVAPGVLPAGVDLFMELLYDFVTGVAPVHAYKGGSVEVTRYCDNPGVFYVEKSPTECDGFSGVWVSLRSGRLRAHYSLMVEPQRRR